MDCIICGSNDWENVDQYRLKEEGMNICKKCGFVTYPFKWKSKEHLLEYYRKDYRQPPNSSSFHSGLRKVHYHNAFLTESLFKDWKASGLDNPVVCEVGAAFGMFLRFCMKENFPKADLNGTEMTTSFRRNAFHEYGLNLTEDIDESKKYDLITSYKVSEHQIDAVEQIKRYHSLLNEDGFLYISVPTWFEKMSSPGVGGFDLEFYYHTNHINSWTRKIFEGVLAKAGFEIIQYDGVIYDDTYLCKRTEPKEDISEFYEDYNKIKEIMDKMKRAFVAFKEHKFHDAVDIYPNYVQAHQFLYEKTKNEIHKNGIEWIEENVIKKMKDQCPNQYEPYLMAGDIYQRYNQWDKAVNEFEILTKMSPNHTSGLSGISNCYRHMSSVEIDPTKKLQLLQEARDITRGVYHVSHKGRDEMLTWIYHDNSQLPMDSENENPKST